MANKILEVNNLNTSFYTMAGEVKAVNGVDFKVEKAKTLGIVGESGSGKSVTVLSIVKLLANNAEIKSGSVLFKGRELTDKSENYLQSIRGNNIGMIFQDPMTSLNPVLSVKYQLCEPLIKHKKMGAKDAEKKAVELLKSVGIPDAANRINDFPHEFSGGMRQRVMIAMAIACGPELLIADEPTTALDVTIQAQILELMKNLKKELDTSIILITHDLGVIADSADDVIVMYGGKVMEEGSVRDIFYNSKHPYTKGLLQSVPNPEKLDKQKLIPIEGNPPDLLNLPQGCPFNQRCSKTMKICLEKMPELFKINGKHFSRCWLLHPKAKELGKVI